MIDPLLRGDSAPPARTLVDIFRETVAGAADEPAVDAGNRVLTYAELEEAADELAERLAEHGIGPGDKVGVRIPSGTTDLYVAVLGVLCAGAGYVPVDAEDPEERARLVFGEAQVAAVVGTDLALEVRRPGDGPVEPADPGLDDDCWVIFTSGSTGKPKGVAVSHRSAAAFVDAESRMFLQEEPLGVGDRVMAGLSVAFDASCEEMWLAWRYGACLVPAPRALVRSGVDVGPWLVANEITVVSTVPTLVALWPAPALERVRLLIMGGEACPPELAARLARPGREVWNTYGPTEATVVACGALLTGEGPVRIGLPLDGWDLAVVDAEGRPVPPGATGELIIGGVGLARYLDPAKDAEKYAPMPTLGWERAYRSGDLVVNDPEGLLFGGRADDQVKLGGRRIELGEVDSALLALPEVHGAAAAVRRTNAGHQLLVGYVATAPGFDPTAALAQLRRELPAALVPRLAVVDTLPTRTSGKVDRDALPWPVPGAGRTGGAELSGTAAWIAELWLEVLGAEVGSRGDDFFDLGGGSLTAAQMVSLIRATYPEVVVGDLYANPTLGELADHLDGLTAGGATRDHEVASVPLKTQAGQLLASFGVRCLAVPRWLTWTAVGTAAAETITGMALPTLPWWGLLLAVLAFLTPPGRILLAAGVVRIVLAPVTPGDHPRGGKAHLRLWFATQAVAQVGADALAGSSWMTWFARLLGAKVGRDVDLHTLPPVTGLAHLGKGCSIEPEVDLSGWWIDGDVVRLGPVHVGAGARIGARSTLTPDSFVGARAEVAPGSAVFGTVPEGEFWSGSPARRVAGEARGPWHPRRRSSPLWVGAYGVAGLVLAGLPVLAIAVGTLVAWLLAGSPSTVAALAEGAWPGLLWIAPLASAVGFVTLALAVWAVVRVAGLAIAPGVHPVRSTRGLAVWATVRVLDEARTWLFPLYSSMLTPAWFRALGARIGRDVEISTALLIPRLTQVNDHAFLADDTLIGGYELGGGWVRVERVKVGKRAFVGNSGMAAPGRKVPKASLVAVLSAAPRRRKARSGESWLGSPPARLRRTSEQGDEGRTYDPPARLKVARALLELCRLLPITLSALLGAGVVVAVVRLWEVHLLLAVLLGGVALVLAGALAAFSAVVAKWALIGRLRPGQHPLWSSFVWRNELADTFVETVAAPWFAQPASGTPLLVWWFRMLGARIGRGVWIESHWLPEADLVTLGDGAVVNHGTVVQTHLFHDRMLSLDTVSLDDGATLGPHSVVLPAARIGGHAVVGPASLVMRGESLPPKTMWIGNPIGPWELAPDEAAAPTPQTQGA
ncbi:Pls/PosA family non-ribosomal peptide synthetase [Nocardioides insulae]|uniref:Pls/PosA family non-ribosomal peptide synthetase n=1 Tax=Nocardioides insulae TaxID=394734 RepID=UPI000413A4F9|nr:Pls/PosA family non-ribosomal peptide synthetase [Nocardioides insulae]